MERLEDDSHIMTIGCTRPLMDCVRLSQVELLSWLESDYGFQREEAWQLMAQVGEIRIANIVDPAYTAVSKFPKRCLPGIMRWERSMMRGLAVFFPSSFIRSGYRFTALSEFSPLSRCRLPMLWALPLYKRR